MRRGSGRIAIAAFAAIALTVSSVAAQGRAPSGSGWSGLVHGPNAVGYRLVYVPDSTRTSIPDTIALRARAVVSPRVIPVRLWYPGRVATSATRATMADIVAARPTGRRGPLPAVAEPLEARTRQLHTYAAQKYARAGGTTLVATDTVGVAARALATRTSSYPDLAPTTTARPLVIFAGGTAHSTDENVALWEFLASHGYVVAALPTVAVEASIENAYLPDDALGLETVTRDIETVLAYARRRPDVDPTRVAVVGFSFGGAAALAAAVRHRGIRAVVGLDASFIAGRHLPMIRSAPLFDVRRLAVPLLEFHRADSATVDLSLVEGARGSSRFSIELSGLDHVDFNSYILLYGPLLAKGARPSRDSALLIKAATYRAMVHTTRLFLDDALGRAPADSTALDAALRGEGPIWADVPRVTIRARRWPAAVNASYHQHHRLTRSRPAFASLNVGMIARARSYSARAPGLSPRRSRIAPSR
jgi:dienelactone hydrolase